LCVDGTTGCMRVQYLQPMMAVFVPARGAWTWTSGSFNGIPPNTIVIAQVVGWGWCTGSIWYTVTNVGDFVTVP
jgi:hypothetical protein